ncbi:hypothetical protein V1477_011459 [Vespula maculifrons]|uniref:Uncharacterized protein n=1 Tax=Vespula maculifrons TaxID=7453 RepID=A0ABD2BZS7_VESMC
MLGHLRVLLSLSGPQDKMNSYNDEWLYLSYNRVRLGSIRKHLTQKRFRPKVYEKKQEEFEKQDR